MNNIINIAIVDDHVIFREGLRFVLELIPEFKVVGEFNNGKDFLVFIESESVDVVLMDISMPEMDGIEASEKAIKKNPHLKIIALSSYGEEVYYYKMIKVGAMGFVQKKSGREIVEKAIKSVYKGENFFPQDLMRKLIFKVSNQGETALTNHEIKISKREKEILALICKGYSNNEIAEELYISPKTVDNHRTNLLSKTNTKNAANLVMYSIKNRIIEI